MREFARKEQQNRNPNILSCAQLCSSHTGCIAVKPAEDKCKSHFYSNSTGIPVDGTWWIKECNNTLEQSMRMTRFINLQ